MGWLADLRRRLVPAIHPARDDEWVRLVVVPLEQRRVLSVTAVSAGLSLIVDEGSLVALQDATYTDTAGASNSPHTAQVAWGDGTTATADTHPPARNGIGTISAKHVYADNDVYHPLVAVRGKDTSEAISNGTTTITVRNVAPTLQVVGNQTADEGALLTLTNIGTFSDPGFGPTETFTYSINWGDDTSLDQGTPLIDTAGSPGTPTAGSFDGSHVYSQDGTYTVTVTIQDDDGGTDTGTFLVTVGNLAPTLTVIGDQVTSEGSTLSLTDIGTFTAPFSGSTGQATDFTYQIDWGDGTSPVTGYATIDTPGSPGVPTTGSFDSAHAYVDDGIYTVSVALYDAQGGSDTDTFTVTVANVPPTIALSGASSVNEGAIYTLTLGSVTDPGVDTVAQYLVNWGDGTSSAYNSASDVTHVYADGPNNYTIRVDLSDEDGTYIGAGTLAVAVANVTPTIALSGATSVDEGSPFSGSGAFVDPGADSWTATVDYGDGTGVQPLALKSDKTFDLSHTFADDGTYTITVMVVDDDGGTDTETFTVTVSNVALALTVVADQTIDEGAVLSLTDIGTFTDPGFDAPGEPVETFTYSIDWGDGTWGDAGAATIDVPGGPDAPTRGSFDGSHVYADNGTHTVTVTVYDDDGGSDTETFSVTVGNVVPAIRGVTGCETVDEGSAFTLADLGWAIEDPGFDNPSNPGGATRETFTSVYTIQWGDGTAVESGAILGRVSGAAGVPTVADFEGVAHTYADNGVYTVWITVGDDDSAPVTYALAISVANVAPTVVPAAEQTVDEGAVLNVTDLAVFTDPGFDNPLRLGGPSVETFHYSIDWGDGMPVDTGAATIDLAGSVGVATAGSFDGSHVYADNGVYAVTLTVIDDDGGTTVATTHVTVLNVDPTVLDFVDNDVNALGQVTVEGSFSDPGFDNPRNPLSPPSGSRESFTVLVDWADGTSDTMLLVGPGPFHFTATHTYFAPPDPLNPAADIRIVVTVTDDNGGSEMAETYADVPGEGVQYVYIDTTPVVPHLVFPRATQLDAGDLGTGSSEVFLSSSEYEPVRADSSAASENYIVLRTVLPDGTESSDYRMPDNALNILPDILSRLPDNRYRVYEIQSDGPERLVRDVFVRQNRVIDQTDASEGIEERPPQSQPALREKVIPGKDESVSGPLTSKWEQWEARHARLPVANEPETDSAEAPGDGSLEEAEPAALATDAARAGGPSVLGTALLALRLRAWREQETQRTRERFARWGSSPKDGEMYPRKPR